MGTLNETFYSRRFTKSIIQETVPKALIMSKLPFNVLYSSNKVHLKKLNEIFRAKKLPLKFRLQFRQLSIHWYQDKKINL